MSSRRTTRRTAMMSGTEESAAESENEVRDVTRTVIKTMETPSRLPAPGILGKQVTGTTQNVVVSSNDADKRSDASKSNKHQVRNVPRRSNATQDDDEDDTQVKVVTEQVMARQQAHREGYRTGGLDNQLRAEEAMQRQRQDSDAVVRSTSRQEYLTSNLDENTVMYADDLLTGHHTQARMMSVVDDDMAHDAELSQPAGRQVNTLNGDVVMRQSTDVLMSGSRAQLVNGQPGDRQETVTSRHHELPVRQRPAATVTRPTMTLSHVTNNAPAVTQLRGSDRRDAEPRGRQMTQPTMTNQDPYGSTESDTDDYSTSQEGYDTVEERLASGENYPDWPWPKMRRAMKQSRRRMCNNTENRERMLNEHQLQVNHQLSQQLKEMRQNMLIQQAKLDAAEWTAKLTIQKNEAEKAKTATLMNLLEEQTASAVIPVKQVSSQQSVTSVTATVTEPTPVNETLTEVNKSSERSRLTQKNRAVNSTPADDKCYQQMGDSRTVTDESLNTINAKPVDKSASPTRMTAMNNMSCIPTGTKLDTPQFAGQNWPAFINKFEMLARAKNWNEATKAFVLTNSLGGEAANILNDPASTTWSYTKLVEQLEMRHGRTKNASDISLELMNMYRRPNQPLTSWYDEVIGVVNTGRLSEEDQERLQFTGFTQGLRHQPMLHNRVMQGNQHHTIAEAFEKAYQFEAENGSNAIPFVPSMNVHMVGAPNADRQLKEANSSAPAGAKRGQDDREEEGLEKKLTNVIEAQFENLGSSIDRRFNQVESRIRRLEQPSRGGSISFNNRSPRGYYEERRQMNYNMNGNNNTDFQRDGGYGGRGRNYGRGRGGAGFNRSYDSRGPSQWQSRNNNTNSSPDQPSNKESKPQPQRQVNKRGSEPREE